MASNNIAVLMAISLCMMLLLLLPSSATPLVENQDLVAATEEMQRANYFTFVTLINMSPPDARLEANITFLMPKDRMLSRMTMPVRSVSDFLLRHSIPSPLLIETLEKFPTGTTIPSSLPNYMLRIISTGRKNFVINNVKIISPNICVVGSSIRCHGIDGILSQEADGSSVRNSSSSSSTVPPPPSSSSCPDNNNSTESSCMASLSPPSPSPINNENLSPLTLTAPPGEPDSGTQNSSGAFGGSSLNFVTTLMLIFAGIYF
ncbi:uncharacterized protein LOC129315155 [Prosopis cineraria]|uniref:uncharacterized protein LOC129315155 n=1 Tax=Prosopis cineraria TaxID=364024 RepID=UPI00240FBDD2|nr:uncharacterized protein LOC129315155 [Prosopis cineraria]